MVYRLLEASQPSPLALVIIHETPDRFTACRGSFMSICLYALIAPQSHPRRAQAVRGYTYTITGRKPAEGRRGAHSVHACTTSTGQHPEGGGRSAAGQAAGRGCRPSAPSATFEISLSTLLPLLGFLRFLQKSLLRLLSRHRHSQGISAQGLSCPSALPEDCSG